MRPSLIISPLFTLLLALPALAQPATSHTVATTKELLAAIEAIPSNGATITLKPGLYVINETIVLKNRRLVYIVGSGWNTVLSKKGDGDVLLLVDSHFCVVKDLRFTQDTPAESGSAIRFGGTCSSNEVIHCRILNFPQSGVRFEGRADSPMSSNTVRDCHFISNHEAQLFSRHNNDFYITGNQFGKHGDIHPAFGAVLDHSSAGTYTMNYHWDNTVALQLGPAANFNRIANNRFEESVHEGLRIGPNADSPLSMLNIITGNTIHTNGKGTLGKHPAVRAFQAIDCTFTSNQIFTWDGNTTRHTHGLQLDQTCERWVITSNLIRHGAAAPITAPESRGHVLGENLVD